MKSSFFVSGSVVSVMLLTSAAFAEGALPSRNDVSELFVRDICYKMRIEVTKLEDLSMRQPVELPFCVAMPELRTTGDCADDPQSSGAYTCPVALADSTQKYVRLSTPGYAFAARFGELTTNAATGYYDQIGSSYYLGLPMSLKLQDVWSYRLTQILNLNKASLPVDFATLILPADNAPEVYVGGLSVKNTDSSGVEYHDIGGTAGPGLFSAVQAIGYDEEGDEYGVHISSTFDYVTRGE